MRTKESWFPKFKPHTGNLETPVQIDEYLPSGKSIVLGLQHAFAMFGATVLAPLLMGFDPNLTILLLVLVPSCSFNYRWAYAQLSRIKLRLYWCSRCRHRLCRVGSNPNLAVALGGTIICGLIYACIGLIVMKTGTAWIENSCHPWSLVQLS